MPVIDQKPFIFHNQAWMLALDIGQYLAKNQFISNENCFTTDAVAWCEVKEKLLATNVIKLRSVQYA